jgi:DNA-directed RNA polymerase subunit RPC12/RpoP
MIRFSCPNCGKHLKAPDEGAGQKVSCPGCSRRLLIPPPVLQQNKTVLGQIMPDTGTRRAASAPQAGTIDVTCLITNRLPGDATCVRCSR